MFVGELRLDIRWHEGRARAKNSGVVFWMNPAIRAKKNAVCNLGDVWHISTDWLGSTLKSKDGVQRKGRRGEGRGGRVCGIKY